MTEQTATRGQLGIKLVELKKVEDQIKKELKETQEAYLAICHKEGNYEEMVTAFYTLRYQAPSKTKTASIVDVRNSYPLVYESVAHVRENKETLKYIKPKK